MTKVCRSSDLPQARAKGKSSEAPVAPTVSSQAFAKQGIVQCWVKIVSGMTQQEANNQETKFHLLCMPQQLHAEIGLAYPPWHWGAALGCLSGQRLATQPGTSCVFASQAHIQPMLSLAASTGLWQVFVFAKADAVACSGCQWPFG